MGPFQTVRFSFFNFIGIDFSQQILACFSFNIRDIPTLHCQHQDPISTNRLLALLALAFFTVRRFIGKLTEPDAISWDFCPFLNFAWAPKRGCKARSQVRASQATWPGTYRGCPHLDSVHQFTCDGGEGCGHTMVTTEAQSPYWISDLSAFSAKQHGPRPPATSELLSWAPTDRSIKKRSIRRAYRRACRDGISWYRGRCFSPEDFPAEMRQQPAAPSNAKGLTTLRTSRFEALQ